MSLSLLSLLIAWLIGWFLIARLQPDCLRTLSGKLTGVFLALGLGLGLCALADYALISFLPVTGAHYVITDLVLLVATGAWAAPSFIKKNGSAHAAPPFNAVSKDKLTKFLWISFGIAVYLAIQGFIGSSVKDPLGGWDAWTTWNKNARLIYRSGADWHAVYSNLVHWTHKDVPIDYPLLLPGMIARAWNYGGKESAFEPALLAFVYTFGLVGLTAAALAFLRSTREGLLAGLALAGTPFFIWHGAAQYGDIPLAYYMLSALIFLAIADRTDETASRRIAFLMAGLSAGLAAWTKNEGLLFFCCVAASRGLLFLYKKDTRKLAEETLMLFLGFLPALLAVLHFKRAFAIPNRLFGAGGHSLTAYLGDPHRYQMIAKCFAVLFYSFGNWVVSVSVALLVAAFLFSKQTLRTPAFLSYLTILGLTLGGYFFTYLLTPYDLLWHLSTSADRLFVQLWPSFVFISFLSCKYEKDPS